MKEISPWFDQGLMDANSAMTPDLWTRSQISYSNSCDMDNKTRAETFFQDNDRVLDTLKVEPLRLGTSIYNCTIGLLVILIMLSCFFMCAWGGDGKYIKSLFLFFAIMELGLSMPLMFKIPKMNSYSSTLGADLGA